jgi:thiol-disulfide isomerase/thioredoxin
MKNYALILLLSAVIISCKYQRPASVDRPVFDSWSGDIVEVKQIETSDSATILHFDAFYQPGWWIRIVPESYIKESGTDNKLMLTKAEGITPGEKFVMPDSGKASFDLYFPPLPPEVTKIDFLEGDCESCFKIWGISLLPDQKVKMGEGIPQDASIKASAALPEPFISNQPARLKGKLIGYQQGMFSGELTINSANPLTGNYEETRIPIDDEGTFSGEVPLQMPSIVYSRNFGPLFLVPGKEQEIYVDLKRKSRFESRLRKDKVPADSSFIYSKGFCLTPLETRTVADLNQSFINYGKFFNEVEGLSPADYSQYMIIKLDSATKAIKEGGYTDSQKKLIIASYKINTLQLLFAYSDVMKHAYFTKNNIPREQWAQNQYKPTTPDEAYYRFLGSLLTDDLAYTPDFPDMINSIRSFSFFGSHDSNMDAIDRSDYFEKQLSSIVDKDNQMVCNIAKAQFCYDPLQKLEFYTEEEKQKIKDSFENHVFADVLISENDKLKKMIEANKAASGSSFVMNKTPDVDQDKVFKTILSKYLGKVIVVDFWATWCGPCKAAIKDMTPLKEELKDENVVFVYLTGETSPAKTWNEMIPDIYGEHYRVSNTQWKYWYNEFGIEGVPTFMVFDEKGKQIARHTGFPGVDKIKSEIDSSERMYH